MIDRIRDLILEAAGKKAAGAGVPMDRAHIHAAAAEVGALVMQARERLMATAELAGKTIREVTDYGKTVEITYGAHGFPTNMVAVLEGAPAPASEVGESEEPAPAVPDEPEPAADPAPESQPE